MWGGGRSFVVKANGDVSLNWMGLHLELGQENKFEIQLLGGPVHFSFQLPSL